MLSLCLGLWPLGSGTSEIVGCFRTPRRKRGIRENQSTATVPVLKRPPDQFAVSQLLDGNVCVYARVVCMLGRARGRITRALIGWLPLYTLSTPYGRVTSCISAVRENFRIWDDPLLRLAYYPSSVVLAKTAYWQSRGQKILVSLSNKRAQK